MNTIAIENMNLGRRYVTARAGYEANWTVTSVRHFLNSNGQEVVEVKYPTGNGVCELLGTEIAIMCDEEGVR